MRHFALGARALRHADRAPWMIRFHVEECPSSVDPKIVSRAYKKVRDIFIKFFSREIPVIDYKFATPTTLFRLKECGITRGGEEKKKE